VEINGQAIPYRGQGGKVMPATTPLCVDLDGTLVNTDTLVETSLLLLKRNPLYFLMMFVWLLSGKANLKEQIASRTHLDVSNLPYNQPLLGWLREQRGEGRVLVLVTAANYRIANAVRDHLELFTEVSASSGELNLGGVKKRDELDRRYGKGAYDYVGNSADDLEVWEHCRRAVIVNARPSTIAKAASMASVEKEFPREFGQIRALIKAMRPHQWSKNLLIFVNLLMAHELANTGLLISTIVAFIAFCLCSSSVYLINDLLDLQADRKHSEKCDRPFASGRASLLLGVVSAPILLVSAVAIAAYAGSAFLASLILYFCVTLGYSLYFKRVVILDVMILAVLYTLRIISGAAVAEVLPSFWLMSFSMFIFTSLAMAKRYAELKAMELDAGAWIDGRGYHVGDLPTISQLGTAAGYIATLVLALYIDSPGVVELYEHEVLIWMLCPLLMFWIGRIWLIAGRGELHQDPVVFATRDGVSYVILVLGLLTLWAAL
jgi:4-hydroxybenzoate polyprenyltransferase/phosphoserine phosphatase